MEGSKIQPRSVKYISVSLFIIIAILPMVVMLGRSVVVEGGLSFQNYGAVFSDTRQAGLFIRSLGMAAGAAALSLIMGVVLAFILARTDLPAKKQLQWLCLLPLCIPPYIHAVSWICVFGDKGVVNAIMMNLLSLESPLFSIYNITGAIAVLAFSYYPFVVLLTISGLTAMDRRLEDAARLNYSSLTVFRKITLPLVGPYVIAGAVFVFVFSLFNYGVPALLRVHTYPVEIFAQFSAYYNEGRAVALSVPVIVLALVLLAAQKQYMGARAYVTMDTHTRAVQGIPLGRFKPAAWMYTGVVMLVTIAVPLAVLIMQVSEGGHFIQSFSTAIRTSASPIIQTVLFSLIAATIIICLTYVISGIIETETSLGKESLDFLTFMPFAFPATVLGIGLIYLWNRPLTAFIYTGSIILIIAYAARFIPFSIRVMNACLKQISPSIRDSAALAEKSWLRRTLKIDLPLCRQGLAAGWIIAFILCMGELGATLLVVPPGKGTLSLKIYTLMHYGANRIVAALCMILICINLLFCAVAVFGSRQKWRAEFVR